MISTFKALRPSQKGLLGVLPIALGLLLYPLHAGVAYAFALGLLLCCGALPIAPLCALYALLFCFDPVLPFALLGGSVVRVMQGGLALRLLFESYRAKAWPKPGVLCIFGAGVASFFLGVTRFGPEADAFSFLVNLTLFLLTRHVLSLHPETLAETLQTILRGFARGVVLSLCWGLAYGRFLSVPYGGIVMQRFIGTYEPNFMAMFANVALAGLLCLPFQKTAQKKVQKKAWEAALLGALVATLLLTYSITGIASAALLWLLLLRQRQTRKATFFRMLRAMGVGLALFACITFVRGYLAPENEPKKPVAPRFVLSEEGIEVAADPKDLVLLPEEYIKARETGVEPVPYRRPRSLELPGTEISKQMLKEVDPARNGVQGRWRELLWYARTGNLDLITSGRLGLSQEKWLDFRALPIGNQFFGAGPASRLTYMPISYRVSYSHNSYLDLLYSFGFVGAAAFLAYLIWLLKTKRVMGVAVGGETARAWKFCRVAVLLHMLGLSMLLNRVALFFFL